MQKKNVLTMALSVSLVGVIAVGGTLAYLTANTNKLTNKFTFTTNGITLQLSESAAEPVAADLENGVESNGFYGYTIKNFKADEAGGHVMTVTADSTNDKGIVYENIVPGAVISKKPVLTVEKDSVNCYVYAIVNGITDNEETDFWTNFKEDSWTVVPHDQVGADEQLLYKKIPVDATVLRYNAVVNSDDEDQSLTELFDTIYVSNSLKEVTVFDDIEIYGYSIQADTFAVATAADPEALTYFNSLDWEA